MNPFDWAADTIRKLCSPVDDVIDTDAVSESADEHIAELYDRLGQIRHELMNLRRELRNHVAGEPVGDGTTDWDSALAAVEADIDAGVIVPVAAQSPVHEDGDADPVDRQDVARRKFNATAETIKHWGMCEAPRTFSDQYHSITGEQFTGKAVQ